MNFWSVEHFFDIFSIKIRFSLSNVLILGESNVLITEESNFDEKNVEEMFIWSEVHLEKEYVLLIKYGPYLACFICFTRQLLRWIV